MRNINYLILFLFFLSSCSSVAGLRDKSYTIGNQGFKANIIESLIIPSKMIQLYRAYQKVLKLDYQKPSEFNSRESKLLAPMISGLESLTMI
jgi:hypothetical protein